MTASSPRAEGHGRCSRYIGSRPVDADGKVLVVYWWASWCPICSLVSPLLDRLWREQAPRGRDVKVAPHFDEDVAAIARLL